MLDLGKVRPGSTIRIPFSSFDKDDGSAITMTNFAVGDILIYKDGGTTERASTSGFTATTDFDAKTGKHLAIIDLADNTTAGFFAAGSEYLVAIDAVTIDAVTTGGWIARFSIGYDGSWFDTTIATLASQTSFTLTVGPAEDDALNGHRVIIHDVASAVQCGWAIIDDYTGSTKTVTLAAATTYTAATTDGISIMGAMPMQPTVAGRKLDVSSGGEAGVDWANVGSPTTVVGLSGTTVKTATDVETDTADIQTRLPAALVSGRIDASVGAMAANVLTATAINADAITAAKIANNAIDAATFAADVDAEILSYLVDDATRIDASALNTLSGHDPGETIMGATDLGTGAGLTTLATQASVNTIDDFLDTEIAALVAAAIVRTNTAQAGAGTTITLDASASATDDLYNNHLIVIASGTGAGQARFISDYVGATKVATVPTWVTNPDNTSVFYIVPFGSIPGATAPTAAEVADAVWDEATVGHTTSGTFGEQVKTDIDDILTDTGTTLQAEVDGIQADTEDIQTRLPAALVSGRMDSSVGAMAANTMTAAAAAADLGTEIGTAVWATATRELTALDEDNTTIDLNGSAVGSVVGAVGSVTGAVGSVTGNVGGNVTGSVGSLAAQAKTDVNAEVVDALATDTYAEPGQGNPGATVALSAKINYLYKAWRNRTTQTATEYALYADDGVTKDQEAAISDDGTTLIKAEVQTGA